MSGLIRSGMVVTGGGRRTLGVVMAWRHTSAREYKGLFIYSYVYNYARSIYVEDEESKGKRKGKSLAFTAMRSQTKKWSPTPASCFVRLVRERSKTLFA
jgi:hypothetical protein